MDVEVVLTRQAGEAAEVVVGVFGEEECGGGGLRGVTGETIDDHD